MARCLGLSARARKASMRLDSLYINYWSLRDPLTESQSLPVVRALAAHGYRMGLVTFEQPPYAMTAPDRRSAAADLRREGILWYSLSYHRKPAILSTLWDALAGLRLALSLARRVSLFHSRGTVAAAPASIAAALTRSRFLYDADGPLSEEYVDAGVWKEGSLPHRLTSTCERWFVHAADAVAVLTHYRSTALERAAGQTVTVLPCCVDTEHFRFDPHARARLRSTLHLDGTVFIYAGKWGGWYASDEMFEFFATACATFESAKLLVLTHDSPQRFLQAARRHGIENRLRVSQASRAEMPGFLSAADVGLSFVRPLPSKRSCSPVKNGE